MLDYNNYAPLPEENAENDPLGTGNWLPTAATMMKNVDNVVVDAAKGIHTLATEPDARKSMGKSIADFTLGTMENWKGGPLFDTELGREKAPERMESAKVTTDKALADVEKILTEKRAFQTFISQNPDIGLGGAFVGVKGLGAAGSAFKTHLAPELAGKIEDHLVDIGGIKAIDAWHKSSANFNKIDKDMLGVSAMGRGFYVETNKLLKDNFAGMNLYHTTIPDDIAIRTINWGDGGQSPFVTNALNNIQKQVDFDLGLDSPPSAYQNLVEGLGSEDAAQAMLGKHGIVGSRQGTQYGIYDTDVVDLIKRNNEKIVGGGLINQFVPPKDAAGFYSPTAKIVGEMKFGRKGVKTGKQLYFEKKGQPKGDIYKQDKITAQEMQENGVAQFFLDNPDKKFTQKEVLDLIESKRFKTSPDLRSDIGSPLKMPDEFVESFKTKKGWTNVNYQDPSQGRALRDFVAPGQSLAKIRKAAENGVIIKTEFTPQTAQVGYGSFKIYHDQSADTYIVEAPDQTMTYAQSHEQIQKFIYEFDDDMARGGERITKTKNWKHGQPGTDLASYGENVMRFDEKQLGLMNRNIVYGTNAHYGRSGPFSRFNLMKDGDGKDILNVQEIQYDMKSSRRKAGAELKAYDEGLEYLKELEGTKDLTEFQYKQMRNIQNAIARKNDPQLVDVDMRMKKLNFESVKDINVPLGGGRNQFLTSQIYDSMENAIKNGVTRVTFPTSRTALDMTNPAHGSSGLTKMDGKTPEGYKGYLKTDTELETVKAKGEWKAPITNEKGLQRIYDTDLPFQLQKIIDKFDLKNGTTTIEYGPINNPMKREVPYIDITPELIEEILLKGKPLFSKKKEKGLLDYA